MNDARRTDGEIEHIVEKAFQNAISKILDEYGLNVSTVEGRQELRADISWLRDARQGTALVRKTAGIAMITTFVSGAAFGLWTMLVWVASLAQVRGHGP